MLGGGTCRMNVHFLDESSVSGTDAGSDTILVDCSLHSYPAVLRCCYALADVANFDLSDKAGKISVHVFPAAGQTFEAVRQRFRTSLIDFALREDIEARTKGMRELIWQTAFGEVRKRETS